MYCSYEIQTELSTVQLKFNVIDFDLIFPNTQNDSMEIIWRKKIEFKKRFTVKKCCDLVIVAISVRHPVGNKWPQTIEIHVFKLNLIECSVNECSKLKWKRTQIKTPNSKQQMANSGICSAHRAYKKCKHKRQKSK